MIDAATHDVFAFVWNETVGGKGNTKGCLAAFNLHFISGSEAVGSCLYKLIETFTPKSAKTVVIYSDNASSQVCVISLLLTLKEAFLVVIVQKSVCAQCVAPLLEEKDRKLGKYSSSVSGSRSH